MYRSSFWVAALSALVLGRPVDECSSKPAAFFLAGDSTTAPDGGWGDGLLSFLKKPAIGLNIGKSGATTASFKAGGYWANVTQHLKDNANKYDTYVTISFGHNDQKSTSGVTFQQYQDNLIKFANEVKSLGGTPLLTSSLTRRAFPSGQDHNATDSLHDQRLAAIEAAKQTKSPIIDLNEASLKYVNAIGKKAAYEYNYGDDKKDTTHLNPHGSVVFGRMVADLIIRENACLEKFFTPNETLSTAIWNNKPA
ncbi:carbohydrate esterase family 12 protein [Hypoxylon trugodes]|uniref:carbohydrate esterase family 12 protein n=1 Tax=Hypoxylon trugodes TaxID=326681 RepID=UPI00219A8622|nr:carbohydrate esterase family 12 protein [Hypoxylon trugodes]KAI1383699.1 carbohydrate esterase family 12 protein [Hypoxylon trugodes]